MVQRHQKTLIKPLYALGTLPGSCLTEDTVDDTPMVEVTLDIENVLLTEDEDTR